MIRTRIALSLVAAATVAPLAYAQTPGRPQPPATRPAAPPRVAITFDNVPLDAFLDTLRDAGLNLAINWPAIEAVGVDRGTPVNLKLRNVPLRTLLNAGLRQAGNGQLAWYVADGVVHVTTRDLSDRALVTKVYPVGDLLVEVPDFVAPQVQINTNSAAGGGGGGGTGLFSGGGETTPEGQRGLEARGERLCELVRTLVRPEVWVENGGVASVRYFAGNLIVTAPRDVQNLIGR